MKNVTGKKKLIIFILVLFVLPLGGILFRKLSVEKSVEVTVEKAGLNTIIETVSASGKIFPETEVKISPDVSGEIIDLFFEEGDSVKKGDLLLTIRPDIYQSVVEQADAAVNQSKAALANARARLEQAKAQFENAKLTFDRNSKLFEQKVISPSEHDAAVAAYKTAEGELNAAQQSVTGSEFSVKSAEAALKESRDNLTRTRIYAPMDGTLSKLNVKKGERVVGTAQMPGTDMLIIADLSRMEVQVDVSENDIIRVSVGDSVSIDVDAFLDKKFKGMVRHVANSSSSTLLTSEQVTNFTVKINILTDSYRELVSSKRPYPFKPGMSATVEIKTDIRESALSVPIQTVTIREPENEKEGTARREEIVFVHEGGKVRAAKVKTGIQDDRYIEITEGLDEKMEVVTGPFRAISRTLNDGDAVKVVMKLKKDD